MDFDPVENAAEGSEIPPILTAVPIGVSSEKSLPPVARWKKRGLFLASGLAVVSGIAWATSPQPRLLKPTEAVSSRLDESVLITAKRVDAELDQQIAKEGVVKAGQAPWLTVARRMSLGLIGNGLSLEEIRVLEQLPEAQRLDWWSEYLLQDRRSSDYLAERLTRATVGTNQGPFLIFRRRKYVDWLADQIQANKPYDLLVRELIESDGSWTDSPQVNFLTATLDEGKDKPDVIRLAGRTSRAFLAQRIDCLQCHNDYLGKVNFTDELDPLLTDEATAGDKKRMGEQADFHQLAAFFSGARLVNPFVGLKDVSPDYRIRYLNQESETDVEPNVPYRKELLPKEGNARHRLAVWVTHPENKAFARATVNRVWANLFGKPLTEPIDSIPLGGPFPPGLDVLAEDFAKNGYNLKRLIKTILCTEVFRRDSRVDAGLEDENVVVEESQEKTWALFPLTQLRPEQVAASIHQASRIKAIDEASSIFSQLELFGGVNDFTKAYGDRGDDEFDAQSVTIPQRLLVMNGSYVSERIKHNPLANAATRIAELTREDRVAVETAYLSTLNRTPSGAELNVFCERLHGTSGNARSQVMSSIFWTLINSTEFQWNH